MDLYKYDTHVHTAETSPCARVNAAELVHLYKDAGYQGVVITDHYFDGYFDSLGDISWEKKIDNFLEGYKNALNEGNKIGLDVILGMELRFRENFNDYLVYGIDEAFLKENKELYNLNLSQFRELISNKGILIYQAHPFRLHIIPADPGLLDGVETFNGNPRHDSKNHKALKFAEGHGLKMLSGSDFHQYEDIARGGVIIPETVRSSKDFARILDEGGIAELIVSG
ncbi:PHP-associated domain-containing protein [Pseudoclostridium thermosuccinogenes]|uniref:PHP domain-containing protein n=1 Tax=Clostridium thermosuccinogenes TaxID=84032 RepID=UPI002FD933AE